MRVRSTTSFIICNLFLFFSFLTSSFAHNPGQSFTALTIDNNFLNGQTDLYLKDISLELSVDTDKDGHLSSAEIENQRDNLSRYFKKNILLQFDGKYVALNVTSFKIINSLVGDYVQTFWSVSSEVSSMRSIQIEIHFLFEKSPKFVNFVSLKKGKSTKSAVLTIEHPRSELFLNDGQEFLAFLRYGIGHIWSGIDHLFFLLLLIFNAFIISKNGKQEEIKKFRPIIFKMIKLATAFTLAHTLTLSLSVMDIYVMPGKVVEFFIMGSIIFIGLDNIFCFYIGREWLLVFGFGLFHGMGFAQALKNLGLSRGHLVIPLVGFNIGVEIGQILIIGSILPGLYALSRRWPPTQKLILGVCWMITMLTIFWLLERILA